MSILLRIGYWEGPGRATTGQVMSTLGYFAFVVALGTWVVYQVAVCCKMMWTLVRWLTHRRKLDRRESGLPPPMRHVGVICPLCFAETEYDFPTGQYYCPDHGLVAQMEQTYYATRN